MDFQLSKNQALIRKSAREFFEKECPKDKTRSLMNDPIGYDQRAWQKMVDLGFVGIHIPENFGGMQGEFMELTLLMEEMGRNIVPSPFFDTVCLCAPALMAAGTEDQKSRYLPDIAENGAIWSLALHETGNWDASPEIQLIATLKDEDYRLNGRKIFVPYAEASKQMLVAVRTAAGETIGAGVTLLIVDTRSPGIEIELIPTAAPGLTYAVHFTDVAVPKENILGPIDGGMAIIDQIIQEGALLKSAEMAGGVQAALEIALRYAKDRIQFNRPIGSFQVMQHKLVKMLQEVDGLRHLVREAAWLVDTGKPSLLANAMAKVKANNVYHRVCVDAVVIHGAIGWTQEMDICLYLLRSKDLEHASGGSDFHREIIAKELEHHQPDFLAIYE